MAWLVLAGGCTDLAFELRELARTRVESATGRDPPSMDRRVASSPFLSDNEMALGLRLRVSNSPPSTTSPVDFLGGLTMFELETGG